MYIEEYLVEEEYLVVAYLRVFGLSYMMNREQLRRSVLTECHETIHGHQFKPNEA